MKKYLLLTVVMVLGMATLACAEWLTDFRDIYQREGIDPAVVEALKQGVQPVQIMENGLLLEGLNPQNLVKAMYCAGIRGDDIRAAAQQYGVTDLIVVAGYNKSVEECGDRVVDTQAYTPVVVAVSFIGPAVTTRGDSVSPSGF
jgi:hypothetical protein